MKRILLSIIISSVTLAVMADDVMRKEGDIYIVNTSTLCQKKGFKSTTPLEVYIENGKVVKITALPNRESKGYFKPLIDRLFPLFVDQKINKAEKLANASSIDAMTGATFSGKAVQANIKAALEYYKKNK